MDTKTLIDYATGVEVKASEEEKYRQQFEHILIDDLGYPKEHIAIEFTIQRGAKRNAERADIVVFNSERKVQENALIIVEIETPKKSYDKQAFSYVTATTAPYCVWFAGLEKSSLGPYYLYRDLKNDPTMFKEMLTLPRYGEEYDSIGKFRKSDLKPAKALKTLFKRIHHKLYGSGHIKREEDVAKEVIKIIFCKILDELSPDELCEFRSTPSEQSTDVGQRKVKDRIEKLYRELLLDPDFGELFEGEKIEYSPEWVTYIVSELQGVGLTHDETNTDALGDAYEVFLPSTFKGESGQFFTPREVVRFALDVIKPSFTKKEIILDTACGSGGFLTIALESLRKQISTVYESRNFSKDRIKSILKDHAGKYIHGMDIEPLLYKIAKSYMAIIGDGKSNIYNFDSLLPIDQYPKEFTSKIQPGTVDVITTNPPFGTKIDDVRKFVLEEYDLGHRIVNGLPTNELLDGQDPDKLFLERDLLFLKDATKSSDGGRMVIILPRQNLSGAEIASVELRKWLMNKAMIYAVVDLPREAFQPHTGTKTSLLFIRKVEDPLKDYPVFMAVSEAVGHDRRGNTVYKKDDTGKTLRQVNNEPMVWNDLDDILVQWEKFVNGDEVSSSTPSCFVIDSSQIRNDVTNRLDAWYYDPNKNDLAKKLMDCEDGDIIEVNNLGDLVIEGGIFYPGRHKRNYVKNSGASLPFFSGTQILQVRPFDLKFQPKDYPPAINHIVKHGWILITRSGSTGRVTIVNEQMDGAMVSEHVIRVIVDETLVDPYYVYAYLASEKIGKVLLEKGIYASVVDHISPQFVSTIPIPRLKPEVEKRLAEQIREAESKRAWANRTLSENMEYLENLIGTATGAEMEGDSNLSDG